MSDFLPLNGTDHVELYVGNAKQSAHYFKTAFGFQDLAYAGLETGLKDRTSYVLKQDKIVLVLTSALTASSPINDHLVTHGDGVKNVALWVDDATQSWKETTSRGAESAFEPYTLTDEHGSVVLAGIKAYGDTVHVFVERKNYRGAFMPGYAPLNREFQPADCGLKFIDHMVGNVGWGEMNTWVEFYAKVMGFNQLVSFDDKDISTEYTALMSKVMSNGNGRIKFPINEPAEGRKKSQIEEYIDFYGGPGVQHLALATDNIIETVTALRARGAKLTDVAVLVVAADDSVMPQTIEAIDHAKAAEVPIVVAVNKIDKPGANPQKTRQDLVTHGLQPEDWGGDTVFVDISAKEKQGLDNLLELLLLQADVLELKANPDAPASGPIVESRLDVGRGPVATMLIQRGTLKPGDAVVAGDAWGKVRAMLDEHGAKLESAGPAEPVEIVGFDKPPPAGEICRVVDSERDARHYAQRRAARLRAEELSRRSQKSISLEDLFKQVSEGAVRELNLVIKGDVQGSVEAAVSELDKIKSDEVAVRVIHTGVGGITESDVMLAAASKAIVVGFNVRPNVEAKSLAEREGVDIRTYKVIYQLTEDIEKALVGMLTPDIVEEVTGSAEVRQLFRASRVGTIAGCMVTNGTIGRGSSARLLRSGVVVWEGELDSLRHLKDEVKEVKEGFECGIVLKGYSDVEEGDVIEAFVSRSVERTEL